MTRTLTIPIAHSSGITIEIPENMISEADWTVLMAVLHAMKPTLVEPDIMHADIVEDDPLRLTPDEAIEVALILTLATTAEPTEVVRRGTNIAELADRLTAHERDDR